MKKKIFVTGISTEVGKTVVSAIIAEALHADYWKPIQAGELDHTDSDRVKELISNTTSRIFPSSYSLKAPLSPHASANLEGIDIDLSEIQEPDTNNHLVIEGAGGLLVPLNDKHTILDIIQPSDCVIVVSRHYLGSINHTLLTVGLLTDIGREVAIIFSGKENTPTEDIIRKMAKVPILGRIDEEEEFTKEVVQKYAAMLKKPLEELE